MTILTEGLNLWGEFYSWLDLAIFTASVIAGTILMLKFLLFLFRKEFKLYKNLRRPIMIITPTSSEQAQSDKDMSMQEEIRLLKKSGFFRVSNAENFKATHSLKDHSLVIVGYYKGMKNFDKILEKVKEKGMPLVIYTFGDNRALSNGHLESILDYPWHFIANFPLNLVSGVFTTLATYDYE